MDEEAVKAIEILRQTAPDQALCMNHPDWQPDAIPGLLRALHSAISVYGLGDITCNCMTHTAAATYIMGYRRGRAATRPPAFVLPEKESQ